MPSSYSTINSDEGGDGESLQPPPPQSMDDAIRAMMAGGGGADMGDVAGMMNMIQGAALRPSGGSENSLQVRNEMMLSLNFGVLN
jgi:hypothetical protein